MILKNWSNLRKLDNKRKEAYFRFYEEPNDFLPRERKKECYRIYWKGWHYQKMKAFIRRVLQGLV